MQVAGKACSLLGLLLERVGDSTQRWRWDCLVAEGDDRPNTAEPSAGRWPITQAELCKREKMANIKAPQTPSGAPWPPVSPVCLSTTRSVSLPKHHVRSDRLRRVTWPSRQLGCLHQPQRPWHRRNPRCDQSALGRGDTLVRGRRQGASLLWRCQNHRCTLAASPRKSP